MTRQEANKEIIRLLSNIIDRYPDLRFNQILSSLSILPDRDFYDESETTLRDSDWQEFND